MRLYLKLIICCSIVFVQPSFSAEPTCKDVTLSETVKAHLLCQVTNTAAGCAPLYLATSAGVSALGSVGAVKAAEYIEGRKAVNNFKGVDEGMAKYRDQKRDGQANFKESDRILRAIQNLAESPYYIYRSMPHLQEGANPDYVDGVNNLKDGKRTWEISVFKGKYTIYVSRVRSNEYVKDQLEDLKAKGASAAEIQKAQEAVAQSNKVLAQDRAALINALQNSYKGQGTLGKFSRGQIKAAGAGLGGVISLPLAQLLEDPVKRALCGFKGAYSAETREAMADIEAEVGASCSIQIPPGKLLALAFDPEKVSNLPTPVCDAVKKELKKLQDSQAAEKPQIKNLTKCTADGFEVDVQVNGRTYHHAYGRIPGGALQLKASFFPDMTQEQIEALKKLPGGANRYTFTANSVEGGAGWAKVDSVLSQWSMFQTGDPLTNARQDYNDAIRYYHKAKDKEKFPSPDQARLDLSSTGRNMTSYVISVGEQMVASSRYLPEAISRCTAEIEKSKGPGTKVTPAATE